MVSTHIELYNANAVVPAGCRYDNIECHQWRQIWQSRCPNLYDKLDIRIRGTGRTWWRHQIETFSALLALCAGNSSVTSEFPSQRPVTRSFDVCSFSLISACTNSWTNNQDDSDLRRNRAHYDAAVMTLDILTCKGQYVRRLGEKDSFQQQLLNKCEKRWNISRQ